MSLKPFIRWYEWGGATIAPIVTKPGRIGADVSPLTKIICDATHAAHVDLSAEDEQRLNIWLDGNVPFYGTYDTAAQQAQLLGKAVPTPPLQ